MLKLNYVGRSKKKTKRCCSKLSAMEMLAKKFSQKAEFKKELDVRRMELEFAKEKYVAEAEERRARVELEIEERSALLSLLKDHC